MPSTTHAPDNPPRQTGTGTTGVSSLARVSQPLLERPTNNLPIELSSFIGRAREIATVKKLLTTTRLLTLTGAGGSGKTRLSLRVAADLVESYADGVWLVELAPLADPSLVPHAVAAVLDVREQPGQPMLDTLADSLRARQLLLVLDNCEHLVDACARLAHTLLRACPDLNILATSREALGIAGETDWTVPLLALPDAQHPPTLANLADSEAIQLFVARAGEIKTNFTLSEANAAAVAQICQRLDGIPLAIELAAARVKVLQPAEIAGRLDDRFSLLTLGSRTAIPRHQTLCAAIDWSYDLLTEPERVLLRRLSVFAGGWTLEAAEQVCADRETRDGISAGQVLDLLSHLVDKSLVIVNQQDGTTRYHLLETIREYACERLEDSGEAEVIRQRHAEFFVELAERVQPTMTGAERKARYIRFDAEQDNLRAAMGWALATQHAELGLRLVGALGEYWFWWASRWDEGWSWISQFLALPESAQHKRARANALKAAINLLRYRGEHAEAQRVADESLSLFRELGDKSGMAWVLVTKGDDARARGAYTEAVDLCRESATLFREIGDQRGLGWALNWLANSVSAQGSFEQAVTLLEESATLLKSAGDDAMAGMAHVALGALASRAGDYLGAEALLRQAAALCREGGDADGANYALVNLALAALAQDDLDRAASQFEASVAWFRQARQKHGLCAVLSHLGYVRHLQGDDRAPTLLLREALVLQQQLQLKGESIQSLLRCAWVWADKHQPQRAARLLGAAEAALERISRSPLSPADKRLYDRHLARARAELDTPTFDTAWAEGRAMTLDQAVEYALETLALVEQGAKSSTSHQASKQEFGGLTPRERQVAAHIARGESNQEIAQALVVSERTVESHVTNILNKLGFSTRAQIRKWVQEKG